MSRLKTLCLLSSLLGNALCSLAQPSDSTLGADKYIFVDGRKMHYQLAGSGNSTVIFENGFWDDLHTWDKVFFETSRFAKVFSV
jgi:hypothetical protein